MFVAARLLLVVVVVCTIISMTYFSFPFPHPIYSLRTFPLVLLPP